MQWVCACCSNACIYVIGGYSEVDGPLRDVTCYNVGEAKQSCVSPLNMPRRYTDTDRDTDDSVVSQVPRCGRIVWTSLYHWR